MNLRRFFAAGILVSAAYGCAPQERLAAHPKPTAVAAVSLHPSLSRWSRTQAADLKQTLTRTFSNAVFANAGIAVAAEDGTLLYGLGATRPMIPASTLKTIVAATALSVLGPGTRLTTQFEALDAPDENGRIRDLWLVGTGDPVLTSDDLRGGIGQLARRGVKQVGGDVIVDASAFRGPEQNPAWAAEDFQYGYGAGTSALSLDWNVVEFKIAPTQVGVPARVRALPASTTLAVHGAPITSYSTLLHIDRANDRNDFTIEGRIAAGIEQSFYRPVTGAPLYVGGVVASMLRERAIGFGGRVRLGVDPLAARTLWEHRSPPLRSMVRQMLFESDNHIAEQLLRVLGTRAVASFSGADGSDVAGARAERAFLQGLAVPISGLRLVDGSGLAEANRIAPLTFVRMLEAVAHSRVGQTYVAALPRVGIEGTVRYHHLTSARGRVRAKSGHIGGVNALVGYVDSRRHGRLAFAVLINGPAADAGAVTIGVDNALETLAGS